jgi:hypothetical protein
MDDIEAFFIKEPGMLPLFDALSCELLALYPDSEIVVQKTCISFRDPSPYCYVSLPSRAFRDRPEHYLIITFGLLSRVHDPRIAEAVEPYPNRWTHHVLVTNPADINAQLLDWIKQAYEIKQVTRRKKRDRKGESQYDYDINI